MSMCPSCKEALPTNWKRCNVCRTHLKEFSRDKKKPRWISHNTGEMPKRLKPDNLVKAYLRAGNVGEDLAHQWNWNILPWSGDIIAYQIIGEDNET